MKSRIVFSPVLRAVAVFLGTAGAAEAASVSIGTQHFNNLQTGIGSGTYNAAVAGQPSPFDLFTGGDVAGPDFDVTWTFVYAPVANVTTAALTLGLYDGDFAASGSQLSLMTVDGFSIAGIANPVFETGAGAHGQYGVYTFVLPPALYTSLADGSATVRLALAGPGLGVLGETTNNGAGLDFARLDINVVPEAGTSLLGPLGGLVLMTRRQRARHS